MCNTVPLSQTILMILDVLAKKSKASAYRGFFAYDLPFFFNNRPCILSMQGLLHKSLFAKFFCQNISTSFAPIHPQPTPTSIPPRMSVG